MAEHDGFIIRYECGRCGEHRTKLWRRPNSGSDLRCASCLLIERPHRHVVILEADGSSKDSLGAKSDQLLGWLPAIPTPDGETFWDYTSVPLGAVEWWQRRPNWVTASEVH